MEFSKIFAANKMTRNGATHFHIDLAYPIENKFVSQDLWTFKCAANIV